MTKPVVYEFYPHLILANIDRLGEVPRKTALKMPVNELYMAASDMFAGVTKGEYTANLDLEVLAMELHWHTSKKRLYFFEDLRTAQIIQAGKCDLHDFDNVKWPKGPFLINPPKGLKTPLGDQLPPAIALFETFSGIYEKAFLPFNTMRTKRLGIPSDLADVRKSFPESDQPCLALYFNSGNVTLDELGDVRQILKKPIAHVKLIFPLEKLSAIVQAETSEEAEQIIKTVHGAWNPDTADVQMQSGLLKLIINTMLYRQAEDSLIRDGLPRTAFGGISKTMGVPKPSTISLPKEYLSTGVHLRRLHMRQLRDDRFYKGEHADKPKGSRVVLVKPALVGGRGTNPKTADLDSK